MTSPRGNHSFFLSSQAWKKSATEFFYHPWIGATFILASCLLASPKSLTSIVGGYMLVLGWVMRFVCLLWKAHVQSSAEDVESREYLMTGPYLWLRGIEELSRILILLSFCVASGSVPFLVVGGLLASFYHVRAYYQKEHHLSLLLGREKVCSYIASTPAFVPKGIPSGLFLVEIPLALYRKMFFEELAFLATLILWLFVQSLF